MWGFLVLELLGMGQLLTVLLMEGADGEEEGKDSKVPIRFSVKVETEFKERVFIVGSLLELGEWDVSKAHELQTFSQTYPWWESQKHLLIPLQSDFQFKCIKVTSCNEIIWEPIILNRRHRVEHEEVIKFEFSKCEMRVVVGESLYQDSGYSEEWHEGKQPCEFGIVEFEEKNVRKHILAINEGEMEYKLSSISETTKFIQNEIHEAKGLLYIKSSELLLGLNRFHNHSLPICFDCRGVELPSMEHLLRCRLVLFGSSEMIEEYMKYVEMIGYSIWVDKGSLIVLNNYGFQVVATTKYQFPNTPSQGQNEANKTIDLLKGFTLQQTEKVNNEYERWVRLIENGSKLISRKMMRKDMEELSGEQTVIIYGDPEIMKMEQGRKDKVLAFSKSHHIYFLLTNTSVDEFSREFGHISPLNIISLPTATIITNNQPIPIPSCDPNAVKQLRQRFLAEGIFQLVYNSEYMVTLLHKYPRMFSVETPFYEEELRRFSRMSYSLKNDRIKIRGIDMNEVVRMLTKEGTVIVAGTDDVLRGIDEKVLDVDLVRVGSIRELERVINR